MTRDIILVCGVQGSGKSWVCRQLKHRYHYVQHDRCWRHPTAVPGDGDDVKWGPPGSRNVHLPTLVMEAQRADRPLITEAPFGERELREKLIQAGLNVRVLFVNEPPEVLAKRFLQREQRPIDRAALSRAAGIARRAAEWGCFVGSSAEVLAELSKP
jgi:dephospho-CoA kinase